MDTPIDAEPLDSKAPEVSPVSDYGEVALDAEIPEQPLTTDSIQTEDDSKQDTTATTADTGQLPENVADLSPVAVGMLASSQDSTTTTDDADQRPNNVADLSPVAVGMLGLSQDDLATVRPRDRQDTIETLSNPEVDGTTIRMEVSEEPLEPPKDWKPGGPEAGM